MADTATTTMTNGETEAVATASSIQPKPSLRKTTTSSSSKSNASSKRRSSISQIVREASTKILESNPPSGMWSATGQLASRAPSFSELRGAGYSPTTGRRRQSQSMQSPPIQEHESAHELADAASRASADDMPFMTPLQTPIAVANSGWLDEPEEMDPLEEQKKNTGPPAKAPSERGSSHSDDTIQGEMGADADLLPAISMMSHDGPFNVDEDTSKRNSVVNTSKAASSSEPGKRLSFIGRLIRGKDSESSEAPDTLEKDPDATPKRRSKNLDKIFGEDTRKSRVNASNRHSANVEGQLQSEQRERTSPAAPDGKTLSSQPGPATRRTRDFADMVEGNGDDFPEMLFGRDSMPTQSFDRHQKQSVGGKAEKLTGMETAPDALKAEKSTPNAGTQAAKVRLVKETRSQPPTMPLPDVQAAVNHPHDGPSSPGLIDDGEEDIDWDEFMREFDECPPRLTKGASKSVNKFFGEDTEAAVSGVATPAGAGDSAQSPLATESGKMNHGTANKGVHRPSHLNLKSVKSSAPKNVSATQEPAGALAAIELKAEKDDDGGRGSSPDEGGMFATGYRFPPKKTSWEGFLAGLKAFWGFFLTPLGFFVTIYGLLVVAWGGMLFLLLCNASPWMCTLGDGTYDCNNINSPRREWVEYDSQILNALFCVTGFGLIPWRFRDFYYLMKFRLRHSQPALRRLAGFHNGWFRLPASQAQPVPTPFPASRIDAAATADESNDAYPLPPSRTPLLPLTGNRAPPTPLWKLDFVVWAFVINTALQGCLSGFMWGLNRYNRPSWSTGLFVALACIVAAAGGIVQFVDGRRIKRVEGIPWDNPKEMDREMGLEDMGGAEVVPQAQVEQNSSVKAKEKSGVEIGDL